MKITGNSDEISRYVSEAALRQSREVTEKPTKQEGASPEVLGDTGTVVSISETSREVQKVRDAIESEPDVRSDEVEAIKGRIEDGTYNVDYDQTAEKMLKTFMEELI